MILDLDCGNTRVKWRIMGSAGVESRGACPSGSDEWLALAQKLSVARVRISAVVGAVERERLSKLCLGELDIEAEFARSEKTACGIQNGYEQPEKLGVDRWLAVIAAYRVSQGKPCCVADCGSAITIDYVSADGVHRGGVIAPGLKLMRNALLNNTREVNISALATQEQTDQHILPVPLGKNTDMAVDRGLKFMEAGLIEIALYRYEAMFEEQAVLVLTGGDAATIQSLIKPRALMIPDLVLDGLALVLP